jgi:hypothetical protein
LPDAIENSVEAGVDGNNPPGTANQFVSVAEDNSVSITLDAVGSGDLTYEIVSQPTNGSLSGERVQPALIRQILILMDLTVLPSVLITAGTDSGANNSNILRPELLRSMLRTA